MHIAYIEDNEILAKSVKKVLVHNGYTITHFTDGEKGSQWIKMNATTIDLVILDILLPGLDGLSVAQAIRENKIHVPILMLTAKNSLSDTLDGFQYGADDYLKKPFSFDELLVRVRALLRRPQTVIGNRVFLNPEIEIDFNSHIVKKNTKEVHLTPKEFALLSYFVHHARIVIHNNDIYEHVFDSEDIGSSNTVEVHIKNIRKKLKSKKHEIPLETIRGRGYRLDL